MNRSTTRRLIAGTVALSLALVAVVTSAGAGAATSTKPATPTAAIFETPAVTGHVGRWLIDSQGRVVLLHGLNLVAKTSLTPAAEGFGEADAVWLSQHGFNVVRLGLTAAALMPKPGVINETYLRSFTRTVNELTQQGILVLIDLHQDGWGPSLGSDGFPKWMTITHGAKNTHTPFPLYYITNPAIQAAFESFWHDDVGPDGVRLQARVAQMFSALAAANGSNPGVLGYDMLNEPWPGTTWKSCLDGPNGCPTLDASGLDHYYARIDTAIRTKDKTHLVFGEPYVLFNFGEAPTHIALPGGDKNSGMAFHMYQATPADEPKVLSNAITWSHETGGALLESEFGATTDTTDIDRMVGESDADLIPWIFWSFDQLTKDLAKPPTASNFYESAVDALVRPHPVAVAGTPSSLAYDTSTRTMTFTWSTTGPTGKRATAGAQTLFDVNWSPGATKYTVSVRGGKVDSKDGQSLTVQANTGAKTVTVTIRPES
jgi:endoglycosylceramidase